MPAWVRKRTKTRKDGRKAFVTFVAFDAHLFEHLANAVLRAATQCHHEQGDSSYACDAGVARIVNHDSRPQVAD